MAPAVNPYWTDSNGNRTGSAFCGATSGDTIGFELPGYNRAWITIAQNGNITFDGPMDLPMPPYTLRCPDDVGSFIATAYEIDPSGNKGYATGQGFITVRGPDRLPSTPTTTPHAPTAPGITPGGSGAPATQTPQLIEVMTSAPDLPRPIEANMFGNMDFSTIALLAIGAMVILPPLFRKKGGVR